MTLTRTATSAGIAPASAPTRTAAPNPSRAASIGNGGYSVRLGATFDWIQGFFTTATATMTPSSPAQAVATTDSIMTLKKIRPEVAPKLRRMPISRTL